MNYASLSNFINNVEDIINNTIENEEFTTIKTEDGNAVIMSESQFECLIEILRKSE